MSNIILDSYTSAYRDERTLTQAVSIDLKRFLILNYRERSRYMKNICSGSLVSSVCETESEILANQKLNSCISNNRR